MMLLRESSAEDDAENIAQNKQEHKYEQRCSVVQGWTSTWT